MTFSIAILVALAFVGPSATAFRITGEGESADHGLFGEQGLNAIPRIGRRSLGENPFENRFRFRFNNMPRQARMGGHAAFRFQGGDDGHGRWQYRRKRLMEAVARDKRTFGKDVAAAADPIDEELALLEVAKEQPLMKVATAVDAAKVAEAETDEQMAWYEIADQYWKEYLNDLYRKAALDKIQMGYGSPLQKLVAAKAKENPETFKSKLMPMARSNY